MMETLIFDNYKHLSNFLIEVANKDLVGCVTLPFDKTCKFFKELLLIDGVTIGRVHLEDEIYWGYDREYYVIIDKDLVVDICPAWYEDDDCHGCYINQDANFYLFDGDVHSSILSKYPDALCYEMDIIDEDDCDLTLTIKDKDYIDFFDLLNLF